MGARRGTVDVMPSYASAFLIGMVTGLRSMTAPAVVTWGIRAGRVQVKNTPLAFLGHNAAPYISSALAAGELVVDKLPKTPSRKTPLPFAARVVIGALCGAALSAGNGKLMGGLAAGALGGVAGTLGGYAFRMKSVEATGGGDLPIALLEDAIAISGAVAIVSSCQCPARAE